MEPHLSVERDGRVSAVGFPGGDFGAVVRSVKRYMGRGGDELADEDRRRYTFADLSGPVVRFQVGSRTYTPPQISAEILRALKRRAEAALNGEKVERVVVTVPAYFNDGQRQATKDAGPPRGSRSRAPGQRADRRVARLRPESKGGRARGGLRFRRRHLRYLNPEYQGRHLRGARDQRRYASRRRRYRSRAGRCAARRRACSDAR